MKTSLKLLMLAGLTGCYKINYTNGADFNSKADSVKWHHTAAAGIVELSQPVPLDHICPNGWGRVHHERSPLNLAVSYGAGAAFGYAARSAPNMESRAASYLMLAATTFPTMIYTPASVTVHCKSGTAYRLESKGDKTVITELDG